MLSLDWRSGPAEFHVSETLSEVYDSVVAGSPGGHSKLRRGFTIERNLDTGPVVANLDVVMRGDGGSGKA
jgi:hypothetical protein